LSAGGKSPVLHHHSHMAAPETTEPVYPVMYVPGTVILARAELFRRVGLLDEAYFFSTEVADLCMQAKSCGYLSVIDTRARAYHALSRSSNWRDTLYPYYIIRNRFLFMRKHHRWQFWLFGFWTLYSLALALKLQLSAKPLTAQAVWLGLLDGLQGRFGGQNERVLVAVGKLPAAPLTTTLNAGP
jgi:GT2 family glycosyltransferase